jgi:hypothetical protein
MSIDDQPTWQSDAEREKLPLVNQHDGKGAKVLDVDDVLRKVYQ